MSNWFSRLILLNRRSGRYDLGDEIDECEDEADDETEVKDLKNDDSFGSESDCKNAVHLELSNGLSRRLTDETAELNAAWSPSTQVNRNTSSPRIIRQTVIIFELIENDLGLSFIVSHLESGF